MHDEFASQGLVVVAVSDEGDKLVSDYVDSLGIQVAVGAGSPASGKYGVKGIPHSVLIDVSGKIVWSGSPYELSKGKVKEALKGAKKRSSNFMAVPVDEAFGGRLTANAKTMSGGNPGKALTALQAIAADEKATEDEKTGAATLISSIEEHVDLLNAQAEGFLKAFDVPKGLLVLDALAKEFAGTIGDAAKKRAADVRKDEKLMKELAGAEALTRAQEQASKIGASKAKGKFQEVVDKHKGTRAAERAAMLMRGGKKD